MQAYVSALALAPDPIAHDTVQLSAAVDRVGLSAALVTRVRVLHSNGVLAQGVGSKIWSQKQLVNQGNP